MDNIKKISERLNDFFSKDNKNKIYIVLFVMGIIGILLIFLSELPIKTENDNSDFICGEKILFRK